MENAMKLNKTQRFILQDAVDSFKKYLVDKPIHCNLINRETIDEFCKNYANYNKSMFKLIDAGVIQMRNDGYAYITDIADVDKLLEA
jgi:hypothetical protein